MTDNFPKLAGLLADLQTAVRQDVGLDEQGELDPTVWKLWMTFCGLAKSNRLEVDLHCPIGAEILVFQLSDLVSIAIADAEESFADGGGDALEAVRNLAAAANEFDRLATLIRAKHDELVGKIG